VVACREALGAWAKAFGWGRAPWQWSPSPLIVKERCYISGWPTTADTTQAHRKLINTRSSRNPIGVPLATCAASRRPSGISRARRWPAICRPCIGSGRTSPVVSSSHVLVRHLYGDSALRASGPRPGSRCQFCAMTTPARYEVLVRTLAQAEGGLLADPYLREDMLDLLADGTSCYARVNCAWFESPGGFTVSIVGARPRRSPTPICPLGQRYGPDRRGFRSVSVLVAGR
jgi:hypothetical protein